MRIFDRPHDLDESDAADKKTIQSETKLNRKRVSDSSDDPERSVVDAPTSITDDATKLLSTKKDSHVSPEAIETPTSRRARHAEVLLADSLIHSHGRTWLRLRWPGTHGGFGGFVVLDKNAADSVVMGQEYPTSNSMKLLMDYDDGLGEGEEGEGGEVRFILLVYFLTCMGCQIEHQLIKQYCRSES